MMYLPLLDRLLSYHPAFLLHIVIETPAFLNFMLFPSGQLGTHTPHVHAIVRQYATLILSSILVSAAFISRPLDDLSGKVAGALAIYHFAPMFRATKRMSRRAELKKPIIPSEAAFHFAVHGMAGSSLMLLFWRLSI